MQAYSPLGNTPFVSGWLGDSARYFAIAEECDSIEDCEQFASKTSAKRGVREIVRARKA